MTKEQIDALPEPTRTQCIEAHRRYLATAHADVQKYEPWAVEAQKQLDGATRLLMHSQGLVAEYTALLAHFPEQKVGS